MSEPVVTTVGPVTTVEIEYDGDVFRGALYELDSSQIPDVVPRCDCAWCRCYFGIYPEPSHNPECCKCPVCNDPHGGIMR